MQRVWNLMFTFIEPIWFSLQKNVCCNDLLQSHYTDHKKGLVFILWSQRWCHKPRFKNMLQNCYGAYTQVTDFIHSKGCSMHFLHIPHIWMRDFTKHFFGLYWGTELDLRVCDSWIMNQFLDPTNQKFIKLIFHKLLIPRYDDFK